VSLDKYQEELSKVLPAAFLDSLDPAYLNSLKQLLQARDTSVHFLTMSVSDLSTKVGTLTLALQRAHEALKDICRSPELLNSLPEEIRSKVYAIGDDLVIQEYAEELAGGNREVEHRIFDLADLPISVQTLRPKLALAAAQEAQQEGVEYVGLTCDLQPTMGGHLLNATLKVKAQPGWQLDRPRMQRALYRYLPANVELKVRLEVEVPL